MLSVHLKLKSMFYNYKELLFDLEPLYIYSLMVYLIYIIGNR